jgi:DUF4097 and DUF4098 domain-containing protein YvlB
MRTWVPMVVAVIVVLACISPLAAQATEVHKEFDGVKSIRIKAVSGDCIVSTHRKDKVIVDLVYDVDPEDAFRYSIDEHGGKLTIRERWKSGGGDVQWTLTVPEGAEIDFESASGDFEASGPFEGIEASTASGDVELEKIGGDVEVSTASGDVMITGAGGDIEVSTASGDVDGKQLDGDIEISTASGDIDVSDSKGSFSLSCASGEVAAKGIETKGASSFSTASGSVKVVLSKTSEYDLNLSAASGDVTLDYNGNPVKGYFEFEAMKGRGRISCPYDFDDEEEFEQWDRTFVRKSFSKGGDEPEIYLSTASGRIVLK